MGRARGGAKRAGDATGAQAIKILMNSLYGVLGRRRSRLFSPAVANAITSSGQHLIRLAAEAVAAPRVIEVIYGDTDSLFVDAGEPDAGARRRLGETPARRRSARTVAAALAREFGCESLLELEFEKLYPRFFLPEVRGGEVGSKKRYAGIWSDDRLEFVGLESVRRDWSEVARRFQRELLERVFHDQPVEEFVRGFVADLRAGRFDDELVYRKAIRKPLDVYTKTTPPHVKAARKQGDAGGRIVAYVMTRAGPEPVGELTAPPDYEHYVEHQLKPIADAVLRFLGGPTSTTSRARASSSRCSDAPARSLQIRVEAALHAAEGDDRPAERAAHQLPLPRGLHVRHQRALGVLAVLVLHLHVDAVELERVVRNAGAPQPGVDHRRAVRSPGHLQLDAEAEAAETLLERRPAESAQDAGRADGRGERQVGLGVRLGDADALEQADVEIAVVGAAQVAELAGQVLGDQAGAVPLHGRGRIGEPGGEGRDAGFDEVVHVLGPQHEQIARQVAARQPGEESAGAGLLALERDAFVEELPRATHLLRHASFLAPPASR